MTDIERKEVEVVKSQGPSNTVLLYVVAIIAVFGICAAASMFDPERAVSILALGGTVLVAFLAMLKAQIEIHNAVNSKMDKLLAMVDKSARAEGKLEGEANPLGGTGQVIKTDTIEAGKIEVKDK